MASVPNVGSTKLAQTLSAIAVASVLVFATMGQYAFGDVLHADALDSSNLSVSVEEGQDTDVDYWLIANGDDGCNVDATHPATVTLTVPAGVSASQNPFDISLCRDGSITNAVTITFHGNAEGGPYAVPVATITGGILGNNGYNDNQADGLAITVTAPSASDITAPTISYTVNGAYPASPDGDNGWYVSNAFVDWTVNDPESTITSTAGCVDTTISTDTAGTTLSCSATSTGGTAGPVSVTIMRDATAPTISGSASPAANADGWNKIDVTVSFTCGDAMSGIASCTADSSVSEGVAQSVIGTAVDNAGNSNTDTVSGINVDETAPSITGAALAAPNGNGWNNADVTVTFTCTDGLSDIKSCTPPITLSIEASGQSATGTALDYADNSASVTVDGINIDKTDPTITESASPDANTNGWNKGSVTVHFTCGDTLSGVDSCPDDVVLSSEGAGQSASGTAYDLAGNSDSATVSGINIDLTDPSVALVDGPVASTNYYFGFVPAAPTCSASDALSGLAGSCSVLGYSSAVGTHTVTASATDKAGNTNTESHTYTVLAWTINGYKQPIDNNGIENIAKAGKTIPVKWSLFAGATELTNTDTFNTLKWVGTNTCTNAPSTDLIEEYVDTGNTAIRYDATAHQFVINSKVPAVGCYKLVLTTDDGSFISALFAVKK